MSRLLTAAVLLAAVAAPAAAQKRERPGTFVVPYIEATQALDLDLRSGDAVTYSSLAAGINAGVATRRAEGQLSYRYERRIDWDDDVADGDVHSGLARGSFAVTPNLTVEGGALATRVRSDIGGAAPGVLVGNVENVSQIYSLYAGPTFSDRLGAVNVDAAYRFGYTKAETPDIPGPLISGPVIGGRRRDYYDSASNHLATARIGVAPGAVLPIGLALSGAYEREDASQLDAQYEGWFGRLDAVAPVSATLALAAGVGYERIETASRAPLTTPGFPVAVPVLDGAGRLVTDPASPKRVDYRTDGVYYDAGVLWRPNRRTRAEVRLGERYGSFSGTGSLTYQASRDTALSVGVYDGIATFGRQLRTGLANLPTQFVGTRDQFIQQYNGCIFSTGGQSPGGCLNEVFQSVANTSYRARGVEGVLSVVRGPSTFGAGVGYANRRLHTGNLPAGVTVFGLEDESWYGTLYYSRALSIDAGFDATAFANWYEQRGAPDGVFSTGAVASYYRRFGRLGTTASLGLYHFDLGDIRSAWNAQALVGARYSF